jgi:hypothetical protein
MLEHLIGVHLVEGVVGERQRDVVEVVDDVRLVIGVDIERPQIGPLGLVGDPDVLGAPRSAADEQFRHFRDS